MGRFAQSYSVSTIDVSTAFDEFNRIITYFLKTYIPQHTVCIKPKDPSFVTPLIKHLLRKRNLAMRRQQLDKASALSKKINQLIANQRNTMLSKATSSNTKQLWSMIKKTDNWGKKHSTPVGSYSANDLNTHFSKIATDVDYCKDKIISELDQHIHSNSAIAAVEADYSADYIAVILYNIRKTSTGPDGIPHWIFKDCASLLSEVIAALINFSINTGCVPTAWKHSLVTPVPKTQPVASVADFRPISVTPIFSRITERLVTRDYFIPYIPSDCLLDQYAYKITGSTTSMLISLTDTVGRLLESNQYVRCIMIDFSKAFDTVNHEILLSKLKLFPIPVNIIKWIMSFLTNRSQSTKANGVCSLVIDITRSIVQGSAIGPYAFITYVSDYKALGHSNRTFKYADDFTLLVPENTDVSAESEIAHITLWSQSNKLNINLNKCKELIFNRPNPKHEISIFTLSCIERVDSAKLLGVFVDRALSFHEHVEHIAKSCNQRFYLLQQMRKQGLNADCLKILFHSIVLSKMLYALSAWGGYISGENESRLNKVLRKAKRYGYTDSVLTFSKLLEQSDEQLFSRVVCSNHCLFHLLEKDKSLFHMSLRPRGHSFDLPRYRYNLTRKSFIYRNLYANK